METNTKSIIVIGPGSWGTALAVHLAKGGYKVKLWGPDRDAMQLMQKERVNSYYLPGIIFPEYLEIVTELEPALTQADLVLVVVPSHAFAEVLAQIEPLLTHQDLVWGTKGFDPKTGRFLRDIAGDILGNRDIKLGFLSGPSFAKELAIGQPTAVTLVSDTQEQAAYLAQYFHHQVVRVYFQTDWVGVQIGAAVKNVLAIAAGIADGLGFKTNTRSALLTRGLAEMNRLAVALEGRSETIMGLSGLGDLLLTCTDDQSRNRRFGLAVGQGQSLLEAERAIGQVVEGKTTAVSVYRLAKQYQVEVPLIEKVYQVVTGEMDVKNALAELMQRTPKPELERP